MSTTEAGRLAAFGKPDSTSQPGVSLQAVIEAARRLDELSCARIVGNIAGMVHAAQKGGQPLGTLTPAAIFVLPDGGVELITGAASPHYAAPEKLRGGAGDRRADVFALGVVLWEVLTHDRLFGGANDGAIKQAILDHEFRPPSELNANVPAELDAICKKALARDPSDRYQSAKVMAAEIEAVLDDAGYPESNEQIAKYITATLAFAPKPPVLPAVHPPSKAVPLPPVVPGATGDTLPPPSFVPRQPGQAAILGSPNPPVEPVLPPSAQLGSQPLPPILEPALKRVTLPATAPAKSAKTEILGSLSPLAEKSSPAVTSFLGSTVSTSPAPSILTPPNPALHGVPAAPAAPSSVPPVTAMASAVPAPSAAAPVPASAPPAMPAATATAPSFAPPAMPAATATAPLFAPPAMPAAAAAPGPVPPARTAAAAAPGPVPPARTAAPTAPLPIKVPASTATPHTSPVLPAPGKPAVHSQPPSKPSIANAETLATPQLAVPPAPPQLSMPPGMTVPPASPGAPLQSSDNDYHEFEDEHHADPAEVIALHHAEKVATGSRDVLAGWGWATGSVQAIGDEDDDVHDTARAGRKRLMIAMGGALGAVVIIAIVAFAFSGSKKPSDHDEPSSAAKSPATAAVTPVTAPPREPAAAPPAEPTNPSPEPPKPEPALPPSPEPANVEPAKAEPSKAAVIEPPKVEPPKTAVAEPAKAAVVEPPRAEPPKTEPPRAEPPKAEPPKKAEPPQKLEPKKPPEPKKQADKAVKRPPSEKLAKTTPRAQPADRGQPLDPYATPSDKPKTDPAAAYKTGLQQYARGDTSGALATLRISLSSNPSFAPTWRGLGLVYEKLGNKEQARSAFKRYLQLAPSAGDADQIRDRLERLGS